MPLKRLLIFITAMALLAAGAAQTVAVTTGGKTHARLVEGDNPPKDDQGDNPPKHDDCDDDQDNNAAGQQYDDDDDCVKPPEEHKPGGDDKPGHGDDNKSNPGSNGSPNGQAASTTLPKGPVTCTSRRRFPLHLWFGAGHVRGGSVTVNGKPSHVVRSGRLSHSMINLNGLNKGIYTVTVKVRFGSGRTVSFVRRYRTCTPAGIGG